VVRTASIIRDESVDNHFARQYNPEDSSEQTLIKFEFYENCQTFNVHLDGTVLMVSRVSQFV
jgi:hypothetical protein